MENLAKIINIGSLINEGLENGDKQNKQNVQTYIEKNQNICSPWENSKIL